MSEVKVNGSACCDRNGRAAFTVPAIKLPALWWRHAVPSCRVCSFSSLPLVSHLSSVPRRRAGR